MDKMRSTRSRQNRSTGVSRETGEPTNPPQSVSITLDEAGIRNLIQQVLRENQGGPTLESTEVPASTPSDSGIAAGIEVGMQPPATTQYRLEPIYGLPSQHTPREFRGTTDPLVADEWIKSVENTMDLFTMTDREKVRYATFLFKGDARIWWDLIKETRDITTMSWVEFKRVFESQYRTEDVIAAKIQEFISLQQGAMTVKEYSTKFNALASFAPGMVSTPNLRRDRFLQGLRPDIAIHVISGPQPPQDYGEALDRALRMEVYANKLRGGSQTTLIPPPASYVSPPAASTYGSSSSHTFRGKRKFQPRGNWRNWRDKRPRQDNIP